MRPSDKNRLKLDKKARAAIVTSLKRYAEEELELTVGDLQADLLLDYILEEIGPSIYNQAIQDARAFFFDKLEDLEATCYIPELPYWPKRDGR